MKEFNYNSKAISKIGKKAIYIISLVYIIYYIICSIISIVGLLSNGLDSFENIMLVGLYSIVVISGFVIGQFRFRYEFVVLFMLLVQFAF